MLAPEPYIIPSIIDDLADLQTEVFAPPRDTIPDGVDNSVTRVPDHPVVRPRHGFRDHAMGHGHGMAFRCGWRALRRRSRAWAPACVMGVEFDVPVLCCGGGGGGRAPLLSLLVAAAIVMSRADCSVDPYPCFVDLRGPVPEYTATAKDTGLAPGFSNGDTVTLVLTPTAAARAAACLRPGQTAHLLFSANVGWHRTVWVNATTAIMTVLDAAAGGAMEDTVSERAS